MLFEAHPKASETSNDILIEEEVQSEHPVIYDSIDSGMVRDAVEKICGSVGYSGLDADGWRRILISANLGSSGEGLRKTIADMIKRQDVNITQLNILKHC